MRIRILITCLNLSIVLVSDFRCYTNKEAKAPFSCVIQIFLLLNSWNIIEHGAYLANIIRFMIEVRILFSDVVIT